MVSTVVDIFFDDSGSILVARTWSVIIIIFFETKCFIFSYTLTDGMFVIFSNNVHHCKSIYSAPFYVYTAKKFPGMEGKLPMFHLLPILLMLELRVHSPFVLIGGPGD